MKGRLGASISMSMDFLNAAAGRPGAGLDVRRGPSARPRDIRHAPGAMPGGENRGALREMLDDAAYRGPDRRWKPRFLKIAGFEIPYVGKSQVIAAIDRSIEDRRQIRIAFCNANTMLMALRSKAYARTLARLLVLNDGVGVNLCARIFTGRAFEENLNGTDFTPDVLAESRHAMKFYLFGARPGVADEAARRIEAAYPRHQVVGTRHGYFSESEAPAIVEAINRSGADLVLVALGNPRQEEFLVAHGGKLDAPVVMAVGALLDFIAGKVVRAPRLMRLFRAEWLFRLAQEPRRLGRRYTLDVAGFLLTILRLRFAPGAAAKSPSRARLWPEN